MGEHELRMAAMERKGKAMLITFAIMLPLSIAINFAIMRVAYVPFIAALTCVTLVSTPLVMFWKSVQVSND